jgi:RNA polymerase sigma factor (sigma-70 family)
VHVSAVTDVEHTPCRGGTALALAEFEAIYRENVGAVMGFFARRCRDPQTVADLTSETVVRAATGFEGFDPRRGSARAWLFGISRHVYANHCQRAAAGRETAIRLAGLADLPAEEIEELTEKIEAQRVGRKLLARCAELPLLERSAVELVDLDGLTPKEAAAILGVGRGVLRMRLSRGRARLRKEHGDV